MIRRARRMGGLPEEDLWNGLFWGLIGAVAGARLGYVIGHFPEVTNNGHDLLGVLAIWRGGISLLAGITGGVLAALPFMRRQGLPFWRTMDAIAPGLALGIAIGRIGDLMIGDHIGKPTSFALGWRCLGEIGGPTALPAAAYRSATAQGSPPSAGCYNLVVHQTALYDLVSSAILFAVLMWLARKGRREGFAALFFVTWYGTVRLVTDFLRDDKRYFGLTGSQVTSLVVVGVSVYLLARYRGSPSDDAALTGARESAQDD